MYVCDAVSDDHSLTKANYLGLTIQHTHTYFPLPPPTLQQQQQVCMCVMRCQMTILSQKRTI